MSESFRCNLLVFRCFLTGRRLLYVSNLPIPSHASELTCFFLVKCVLIRYFLGASPAPCNQELLIQARFDTGTGPHINLEISHYRTSSIVLKKRLTSPLQGVCISCLFGFGIMILASWKSLIHKTSEPNRAIRESALTTLRTLSNYL